MEDAGDQRTASFVKLMVHGHGQASLMRQVTVAGDKMTETPRTVPLATLYLPWTQQASSPRNPPSLFRAFVWQFRGIDARQSVRLTARGLRLDQHGIM